MNSEKLTLDEVKTVFSSEYSSYLGKFTIEDITLYQADED
jgi:hypothetical protein